jgi:hypothetical protein
VYRYTGVDVVVNSVVKATGRLVEIAILLSAASTVQLPLFSELLELIEPDVEAVEMIYDAEPEYVSFIVNDTCAPSV